MSGRVRSRRSTIWQLFVTPEDLRAAGCEEADEAGERQVNLTQPDTAVGTGIGSRAPTQVMGVDRGGREGGTDSEKEREKERERREKEKSGEYAKCRLCGRLVKVSKSTTNLRGHVKAWHKGEVEGSHAETKSRPERRKATLPRDGEERKLCLEVYRMVLQAVRRDLGDLPVVRGCKAASQRVDRLIATLIAEENAVRHAVEGPRALFSREDLRLHVLNVLAEQRRARKRREKAQVEERDKLAAGLSHVPVADVEMMLEAAAGGAREPRVPLPWRGAAGGGGDEREPPAQSLSSSGVPSYSMGKGASEALGATSARSLPPLSLPMPAATPRRTRLAPSPSLPRQGRGIGGKALQMELQKASLAALGTPTSGSVTQRYRPADLVYDVTPFDIDSISEVWEYPQTEAEAEAALGLAQGSDVRESEMARTAAEEDDLVVKELVSLGHQLPEAVPH